MMAHIQTRKVGRESRYDVCWRESGKSRSRTFIRVKDAEKFAVDIARRHQLGTLYEAPAVTLREARDDWRSRWMIGKAASTVLRKDEAWPHVAALDAVGLDKLQPALLDDTIAAAARVAPRQAQIALQTVKQVLRDAQARGQRFPAGLLSVKAPSYEEREPVFLTFAEVELVASWCSQPRLLVFLALSGLRIGEALALRESEVDRESKSVLVSRSASKGREGRTKTRKRRRVYLCDVAWQTLLEQLVARPVSVNGLVFPSPRGLLWDSDNFREDVFCPAVERATTPAKDRADTRERIPVARREAVARLTPHDLRHSYASLALRAGINVRTVADQMGHSDGGALLLKRYGHLYADAGPRAARVLDLMLEADRDAVRLEAKA